MLRFFFKFYFIFKLYIIVLVLPNIKMNPPQVYMCSPSRTLLSPLSPYHPSGPSQCTSPKHPASCIEPGLATRFILMEAFDKTPYFQWMRKQGIPIVEGYGLEDVRDVPTRFWPRIGGNAAFLNLYG